MVSGDGVPKQESNQLTNVERKKDVKPRLTHREDCERKERKPSNISLNQGRLRNLAYSNFKKPLGK